VIIKIFCQPFYTRNCPWCYFISYLRELWHPIHTFRNWKCSRPHTRAETGEKCPPVPYDIYLDAADT